MSLNIYLEANPTTESNDQKTLKLFKTKFGSQDRNQINKNPLHSFTIKFNLEKIKDQLENSKMGQHFGNFTGDYDQLNFPSNKILQDLRYFTLVDRRTERPRVNDYDERVRQSFLDLVGKFIDRNYRREDNQPENLEKLNELKIDSKFLTRLNENIDEFRQNLIILTTKNKEITELDAEKFMDDNEYLYNKISFKMVILTVILTENQKGPIIYSGYISSKSVFDFYQTDWQHSNLRKSYELNEIHSKTSVYWNKIFCEMVTKMDVFPYAHIMNAINGNYMKMTWRMIEKNTKNFLAAKKRHMKDISQKYVIDALIPQWLGDRIKQELWEIIKKDYVNQQAIKELEKFVLEKVGQKNCEKAGKSQNIKKSMSPRGPKRTNHFLKIDDHHDSDLDYKKTKKTGTVINKHYHNHHYY